MKSIGLLARADNSGLGTLCWEFANHIKFDQIKIVSNGRYKTYPERFYNLVNDLTTDVILSFETFYNEKKNPNQKLVLVPMYECTHPAARRMADKIISPSLLDKKYFPESVFLPIPINRSKLPFKLRQNASVFVHNAGHGGLGGRNGTKELIEAFRLITDDIKLIINTQIPFKTDDSRITIRNIDYDNYWEIWEEGDVFVFPEKFNGLSLPIQEAMSVGMPIICTDRYPFNAYLPREIMVKPSGFKKERISIEFDMAIVEPIAIAEAIKSIANKNITKLSKEMDAIAESMSWEKLADKWKLEIQKSV